MSIKAIVTAGGTAGHINPALALAGRFQELFADCEILFVGAERGLEKELVPKAGYPFRTVHISSFHRSFKPREVTAGVPMRIPLVQTGFPDHWGWCSC